MSRMIRLDASKCVGCGICELACSINREGAFGRSRSSIRVFDNEEDEIFPVILGQVTDAACNSKVDVVTGKHHLDWCTMCRAFCPSKASFMELKNTQGIKCDKCGVMDFPKCVEWCPTEALTVVEEE